MLRLIGVSYVGSGRDTLRAGALLFRGVIEGSCTGKIRCSVNIGPTPTKESRKPCKFILKPQNKQIEIN
jgi:hypothetical protein